MNKLASFYLDFVRVMAAFGVLFVHADLGYISNHKFLDPELGHKLVMVFFVLSGFLIAYSTDAKSKNLETYLEDRLSRLYSVVFPAYVYGIVIAIHLFAIPALKPQDRFFKIPSAFQKTIKYLSSVTFTIYLFQYPTLIFLAAVIPNDKDNYVHLFFIITVAIGVMCYIAYWTEGKRNLYKSLFFYLFQKLKQHVPTLQKVMSERSGSL